MASRKKNLEDLKNVGKATLRDLKILGIHSVEDLATQDPTQLYEQLEIRTGHQHDPCMWDVFAAITHEAKTGEPTTWWSWTPQRKELQKAGKVSHAVKYVKK